MNFSLINGHGTCENNIHGHSFEVALVSSPIIIIVTKKTKQTSVRKILQFYSQ